MPGECDDSPMNGGCDACNKRAAHPPGAFAHLTNTQMPPVNGSTISSSPERKPACSIYPMTISYADMEEHIVEQVTPFAALVGIDWSDAKHDICLVETATGTQELSVVKHTPEALNEWARALRCRFGGAQVAVCLVLCAIITRLVALPIVAPRTWRSSWLSCMSNAPALGAD